MEKKASTRTAVFMSGPGRRDTSWVGGPKKTKKKARKM